MIMLEAAVVLHQPIEHILPLVAKGRMTQVMGQGDRLGQIFIQSQRPRNISGDGGHLHRMRKAGAEMVAGAIKKNLRFVFEPPKCAGVDDSVAIPLILGAPFGRDLVVVAPAGLGAELGKRSEQLPLALFKV